ncbi:hypothetical protein Y1Q_0001300 [Alligator mississippiensis]|uniref:Uncharacterized protein n=1 Tax=Alligator mississippiensis TaxID=8496 RepID=A0A151M8Y7_ALLMI|nr:hypothetical protein Y1Q_0001300 [Alligator mississippiensis]
MSFQNDSHHHAKLTVNLGLASAGTVMLAVWCTSHLRRSSSKGLRFHLIIQENDSTCSCSHGDRKRMQH